MPNSAHRELLRHVLAAISLGPLVPLAGCGGNSVGAAPSSKDAASDESVPTAVDASTEMIIGQPPIVIPPPSDDADIDGGRYCRSLVVQREHTLEFVLCPADSGIDAGDGGDVVNPRAPRTYACLPAPLVGQSCSDTYSEACVLNTYSCGLAEWGTRVLCGPLPSQAGQCCYIVEGGCPVGRPFLVAGVARVASARNETSWARSPSPDVASLDNDTRAALADAWTQDGLTEHASVASFSRFVLQCLAVGAPAEIVEAAERACADELEHARIAFGLASAYAGHAVGPGPLEVKGSLDEALDAADIACSVASEGCIAELVSAALIAAARDQARDPVVQRLLSRIAEQELSHALLAWRYLAWVCSTSDARLRSRVARIFDQMHDHVGFGARTPLPADVERMRAHGYLPLEERRSIAHAVLTEIVGPASRTLLAPPTRTATTHPSI